MLNWIKNPILVMKEIKFMMKDGENDLRMRGEFGLGREKNVNRFKKNVQKTQYREKEGG